ncbi:hypothetical protein [Gracilimonas tropica]|uniref:hypothetical protein n=1 Tax=Gracilimonas tropica TaxID=454600 RepID=UPI0012F7F5BF|nr:hypothetical protein [Gracilimonas tropica]
MDRGNTDHSTSNSEHRTVERLAESLWSHRQKRIIPTHEFDLAPHALRWSGQVLEPYPCHFP